MKNKLTLMNKIYGNLAMSPIFLYFIYPNNLTKITSLMWGIFLIILINRMNDD